jgi:KaiC/GvpD/RAD55 family RecA-like ATPase
MASAPAPYPVRELDQFPAEPPRETVQGLYGPGNVVAMVGTPGAGKTAAAVHHALHVAANEPWFGRKIDGGPVLYLAPEAPASVVMRARAAKDRYFSERRIPFYVCEATPELGDEAHSALATQQILATIKSIASNEGERVRLVLIDTLASCLGDGDENSDGMVRLVAAAKHIALAAETAIILVHHPSKAGEAKSPRGHGSLQGACDTIITVTADDFSGIRTATLTKRRDGPTGVQLVYLLEPVTLEQRDSFGDPMTTVIVKPATAAELPRKRPGGKSQDTLLTELERRHRTGETWWDRATILKAGRGIGMHRNSSSTACTGLFKAGFLVGSDSHISLKDPPEDCT